VEKSNSGKDRRLEGQAKPNTWLALLDLPHGHYPDPDPFSELLHGPAPFATAHADAGAK
jgi:hypothetical protein